MLGSGSFSRAPLSRHKRRESSRTEFKLSTHTVSTGPSKTTQYEGGRAEEAEEVSLRGPLLLFLARTADAEASVPEGSSSFPV